MEVKKSSEYKGKIAFFYRNSWYHRKKEMLENGKIKYGRIGGFKTPEEAEESYYKWLDIFEEQSRDYIAPKIDKDIMLKDYIVYWFEKVYSPKIETTTAMITSYSIYSLIIPNLPYDIKVRLITSDYLEELLDKVNTLGKTTANKSRQTLSSMLSAAVLDGILTTNPIINTKEYRRGKPNIKILTKKEISILLEKTCNGRWYLEILLALFCGLRKGEIRGLKFKDFNKDNQTLRISRQMSTHYCLEKNNFKILSLNNIEADPKTDNGFRILRAPKIIWEELERRKELISYYKITKPEEFIDNDYISCQANGIPHASSSINSYLRKICRESGLPSITLHGLRHMYATILIEQGVSLAKISALLGHSSVHTTFDFYCDVISEKERITAFLNNEFAVEESE